MFVCSFIDESDAARSEFIVPHLAFCATDATAIRLYSQTSSQSGWGTPKTH